ncbi:hypothetical protein TWF173_002588 [Orbilia oligospora]|nr:hypothetical protein TWF173_002588 [Orbilia oligospora]
MGPGFRWPISRIHVHIASGYTGYNYLLLIDRADSSLAIDMKLLFYDGETSVDRQNPKDYEAWQPNVVIAKIFYFIVLRSSRFLRHAEAHLQLLADTIMTRSDEKPDFKFQIETTKALHQLMFNWAEVRRRILAALSLVKELPTHPFIVSLDNGGGLKTRIGLQIFQATLEDNVERLDSLTEKTKALNSLFFNLANLHDSRAAVEEARAANAVATSLQRITSLTFVYLPITLVATIYGMNLSPITGDEEQKGIWAFFAVSAGLLVVTIGVLGIWIWKSQIVGWFEHGHRGKSKVELHQQEKNIALAELEL